METNRSPNVRERRSRFGARGLGPAGGWRRRTVPAPVFVPADAENPYDNEPADINGHGVQLYLRTPLDGGAWLVVPEAGRGDARVRRLHGWGTLPMHRAEWQATA